ncbi:MAG: MFS transporter, partial [Acidimicrobiia bacterium]
MSRVVDVIAPPRLGSPFRWLLASSWVSNVGDGVVLAAGPLLVASQTDRPILVAAAVMLQQLPWLLFGLSAGVAADRLDRRRLAMAMNVVRAVVLVVLAATIATGAVTVSIVLVSMFLLGTTEVFADTTATTLLPMLVHRDDLGVGNARLQFGQITINRLAAPPLGAALFAAGMALPFVTQAIAVALAAVLVSRIGDTPPATAERERSLRREVAEGLRWVWGHDAIRLLVLTILAFNVTFGATYSIMVLYASERLGLGALGFGLLTTFGAVGGMVGAASYARLERRLKASGIMRVGLVIETLTHLVLAVTTVPAVAFATMFVFGIHEASWGTTASTIRQRVVPNELQGRVGSVYMVSVFGSL